MAGNQVQNSVLKNQFVDLLGLSPNIDALPSTLSPGPIIPTFDIGPQTATIVRSGSATTTGSITVFTTPTDRDFFLTNASLSYSKDVTCDVATGAINLSATIDGVSRNILSLANLTTLGQTQAGSISLNYPVKIDRNTSITVSGSFTLGSMSRTAQIQGFTNTPR